jgi:hypothetical protein
MPEITNNGAPRADRPTARADQGVPGRTGASTRPASEPEAEQAARRAVRHGAGHVAVNAARQAASPATAAGGDTGTRPRPDEERIRRRAHAIWEREGRPEGRHEEHWAQARREVEAEESGSPGPARPDASPADAASGVAMVGQAGGKRPPPPDAAASEAAAILD